MHLTVQARFGAGASKKDLKGYLVGVLCYLNLTAALQKLFERKQDNLQRLAAEHEAAHMAASTDEV